MFQNHLVNESILGNIKEDNGIFEAFESHTTLNHKILEFFFCIHWSPGTQG